MNQEQGSLLGRGFSALYRIPSSNLQEVVEYLEGMAGLCVLADRALEQDLDAPAQVLGSAGVSPDQGQDLG